MNVRQMVDYLGNYDQDDEIEVEVRFAEARESYASTFDVSAGPHKLSDEGQGPVISAGIGFGTMPDADLDLLIDCVKGIDERLGYYRDGA
jgi:hypothetical protein